MGGEFIYQEVAYRESHEITSSINLNDQVLLFIPQFHLLSTTDVLSSEQEILTTDYVSGMITRISSGANTDMIVVRVNNSDEVQCEVFRDVVYNHGLQIGNTVYLSYNPRDVTVADISSTVFTHSYNVLPAVLRTISY